MPWLVDLYEPWQYKRFAVPQGITGWWQVKMSGDKVFYATIVVESNEDGYLACCADMQGAFAEGDTIEEAIFNCVDVIKMIAAYRAGRQEAFGKEEIDLTPERGTLRMDGNFFRGNKMDSTETLTGQA